MKAHTLILATAILSLCSVRAGTTVTTDNSKDKLVSPTEPAAKKGGLYLGLFGGVNFDQSGDSKDINVSDARPRSGGSAAEIAVFNKTGQFEPGTNPVPLVAGTHVTSPTFSTDVKSNTGWLGGLKLGYDFNTPCIIKPALEIEAFYNGLSTSGDATSKKTISGLRVGDNDGDELSEPFLNPDSEVAPSKVAAHYTDTINSAVFMFNGIIRFDLGNFRPYIGGGVGLAYVTHSYSATPLKTTDGSGPVALLPVNHNPSSIENAPAGYLTFGSSDETTFAWQGLAGVDYLLTSRLTVFVEYKALFYLDGPYYRNLLSNTVSAGVKVGF